MTSKQLHNMNVNDFERDFIANCDQDALDYLFGDCENEEEVKGLIEDLTTFTVDIKPFKAGQGYIYSTSIDTFQSLEYPNAEQYIFDYFNNGNEFDFSECDDIILTISNRYGDQSDYASVKEVIEEASGIEL